MPYIRALTFFLPFLENYEEIGEYIDLSRDIIRNIKIKPWTVRYVIPPIPRDPPEKKYDDIINYILSEKYVRKFLFNILPIYSSSKYVERVLDVLSLHQKFYSTIYLEDVRNIDRITEHIYLEDDIDPDIFTRISITHFKFIQTPYFPSTANLDYEFGFSISLRYVDLFRKYLERENKPLILYLKEIKESIEDFISYFKGIDYSLSPWMSESVAELIENYSGIKLGEIGSLYAVHNINMEIKELIKLRILKEIGFNEVMLPVGEDNLLKKRVDEGTLKLQDLIGLSSVCVAGLDMVAIKRDKKLIRNILLDMNSIASIKRRPIGTRIIPIESDEGIHLKRFGYIPLIKT